MQELTKIVVGVDLSEDSERAVAHAVDVGRRRDAEVVLVVADAIPEDPDALAASSRDSADVYLQRLRGRLTADRNALEALRGRWAGQGTELSQLVVEGYPDEQLAKVAADLGAGLIVVATHGRTGFKRFFLGSVAERVVRLANCSVLVARGAAPAGGYSRVVVGTDFSEFARVALAQAIAMAAPAARIDLVHCWSIDPIVVVPDAPVMITGDERRAVAEELQRKGEALVAAAGATAGRELRFELREQPAASGLDELARDRNADLIVVGSHGRRGLRRFLLGSVAEVTVRHAPCSVLVAR